MSNSLLAVSIRRGGAWTVTLAVTGVAVAAISLTLPALVARLVNRMLAGEVDLPSLVLFASLGALSTALTMLSGLAHDVARAKVTGWLRHRLVTRVLSLGMLSQRAFAEGDLAARTTAGTAEAADAGSALFTVAASTLVAGGGLVALVVIDPWLAAAFLAGLPAVVLLSRGLLHRVTDLLDRYQRAQSDIGRRLLEALRGHRTIAASGTGAQETARILLPLTELHRQGMAARRAEASISSKIEVLVPVLHCAVIAVAGVRLTAGALSAGDLLAAARYASMAAGLVDGLGSLAGLGRARAGIARVAEVLAVDPGGYGTRSFPPSIATAGQLRFDRVTVDRTTAGPRATPGPRHPILREVTFTLPGGCLAAVVGHAGCGKSTLLALAGRLRDPDSGTVLLDGVPLPDLDPTVLRGAVRFAFARPVLVGETISEAIGLGPHRVAPATVRAAAVAARADGFVMLLPHGYRTQVAHAPFSGGERQRLGLARAFCTHSRLLLLDDALAGLDTVTELQIGRILTETYADRTRLVATHRATTAARADLVVWLDQGTVRAVAPHDRLWENLRYRAVFQPSARREPEQDQGLRDGRR